MEKTKLRMCIIGVGNAGNQIALAAHGAGHAAFAINTSEKDLGNDVLNSSLYSYIIGTGGRGSGKRRETAKLFLSKSESGAGAELNKMLSQEILCKMISDSDIIIVVASTGGGSGSGLSPVIASAIGQKWKTKTVMMFGVLPKHSESPISHYNTMGCVREIDGLKIPYYLLDLSSYEEDVYDVAYEKIKSAAVKIFNVIRGDYLLSSQHGMMDELDTLTVLSEPGYQMIIFVDDITQKKVENSTIQSMIVSALKSSPCADIQKDGVVKQMGIITNLPDEVIDPIKAGNYSELEGYVGKPLATFENYSVSDSPSGSVIVILSGMSLPYNTLMTSIKKVEEYEKESKVEKKVDLSSDLEKHSALSMKDNLNKIIQMDDNTEEADSGIEIPDFLL